jgi:GNAT superfamily N-acetyltransferase
MSETDVTAFGREHLDGALQLLEAEGWGLVQLQSDGEIQAHLSALLVGEAWRGRGISRRLLAEALRQAGGMRMDIISVAEGFYRHLGADSRPGFRLRPHNLE